MQKRFLVGLVFMLIYNTSFACDLCTIYLGIQPNDFKNSVGIRYRYRAFEKNYDGLSLSTLSNGKRIKGNPIDKHNGAELGSPLESYLYIEEFNSYDIFINVYLHPKWQLNVSTYFADNYIKKNDSIVNNVGGIGDINLLLKYQLINSQNNCDTILNNKFIHRLTVGAGITLPTGNFNKATIVDFETEFKPNVIIGTPILELDPHMQAGTGAFGYLFLMEYLIKVNAFGLNFNTSYKLNTTNRNEFKFANRFNSNISLFSMLKLSKKVKIMPQAGFSYEQSKRDEYQNKPYMESGGSVLFGNFGLGIFLNKLRFSTSYYKPVYESLYDDQPLNKLRLISQINYYF
jgi:hypothetical protein